jgi:pimeloyl-ACP methyl ester carboxylesterase
MPVFYCIWALLLAAAAPAAAQQGPPPLEKTGYNVFLRGSSVGREDVTVVSGADGTVITSEGRLGPPFNAVTRHAEIKYGADWSPLAYELEGTVNAGEVTLRTTFDGGHAVTAGSQAGNRVSVTHDIAPQSVILPNGMFGAFAALTRRLLLAAPGSELNAYVLPVGQVPLRVDAINVERMQMGTSVFSVRHYDLTLRNPNGALAVTLIASDTAGLIRVTIPAQSIDVIRDDLAASTSRTQIYSNPGDEAVIIPAVGFNLGATITRPPSAAANAKLPAVILLAGSGVGDRDGVVFGIPTLAQLAGAMADAGFLAVRYDKRGFGQSGGRAESATLSDYAEDVRAVVKWLVARKDIDAKRIAVVGHSEGAMVALMAAAREKRIAAVVSLEGPSTSGADLVLEQQEHALASANTPAADREAKVALQKKIMAAVISGQGWEGISPEMRRQADTPWFQSLITYDPAKVLDDVRQPLLIVHGALDKQVPVAHADRLAELARKESKSKSIEVVIVKGVNHLLVPATTGEVSEYGTLTDRNVSHDVTMAVTGWLTRTFASVR